MAIRKIRQLGDGILRKKCREVPEMTPKLKELVEDMYETMYEAEGVGLAAPQVGILKRIVVIDVDGTPYTMVNPKILEVSKDTQDGSEGCLSVPGKAGVVIRPAFVKAEAWDENMEHYVVEADGYLARAICHEVDHLEGIVYVDKVDGELYDVEPEDED
ncbi:MAG: peptide deformylase [Lachnospiraceae bacterium]|jgi:peptide deformylase|uniref:peptide deformylase n=1 Tax=Candidatus Merdisoma sp. JLR.KK006 TaxID=3112626 RepID=UPI002FF3BC92|nr:peptide deformylase [Lachnospiraceae bacterium]